MFKFKKEIHYSKRHIASNNGIGIFEVVVYSEVNGNVPFTVIIF